MLEEENKNELQPSSEIYNPLLPIARWHYRGLFGLNCENFKKFLDTSGSLAIAIELGGFSFLITYFAKSTVQIALKSSFHVGLGAMVGGFLGWPRIFEQLYHGQFNWPEGILARISPQAEEITDSDPFIVLDTPLTPILLPEFVPDDPARENINENEAQESKLNIFSSIGKINKRFAGPLWLGSLGTQIGLEFSYYGLCAGGMVGFGLGILGIKGIINLPIGMARSLLAGVLPINIGNISCLFV